MSAETTAAGRVTLVSIITPTLNQGGFIRDAIDSLRAQTYSSVEHLVVDGGSTDDTLAILREAESTYAIRWISEPDRGMYDAINKGLAMASGDVLAYLNSDDVYPPWAIEVAVRELEANPSIGAVYGDGLAIDERSGRHRLTTVPKFDRSSLALIGSLVQPAVFFRRRVYESLGGFDESLSLVGDLDYWLRAGAVVTFKRVDEVLAIERVHDDALSVKASVRMREEEAAMRAAHAPVSVIPRPARLLGARLRALVLRRYLWLRFLAASRRRAGSTAGPWRHFVESGVDLSAFRTFAMFIPRLGGRFAWDAVRSKREWFRGDSA